MNRLRILLLIVAVTLLVPLVVLVRQAQRSLEREQDLEYRTVAERVFDEMERELSTWLAQEEDRPYSHYRFYFIPEEAPNDSPQLKRSPLSEAPERPFVVAYFQVDPSGETSTPQLPANPEVAAEESGWQDSAESQAQLATLKSDLDGFWISTDGLTSEGLLAEQQLAERRLPVRPTMTKEQRILEERKSRYAPKLETVSNTLEALESLNRGADSRQKRASKQELSQANQVYNFSQIDPAFQNSITAGDNGRLDEPTLDDVTQALEALDAEADADNAIDIHLEPLVGRANTAGKWILYRTVLIGPQAFRQGIVLDTDGLVTWAAGRALGNSSVAQVQPWNPSRPPLTGSRTYTYRFAAPFDGLGASVTVAPLTQFAAGQQNLLLLAALLGLAIVGGFFALDRMVAVTVSFAKRRSNFVSSVTHELKTPLTALRMYGEMLRDGVVPSDDKRQQYYEIITRESERLTRLVDNVLTLSRLENKSQSLSPVVGSVKPVIDEMTRLLRPHVEKQGFELAVRIDDDLPQVKYDRDALLQVLFNLVDNALKYSRQANPQRIEVHARATPQGGVVLEVSDHGPGVSKRHLRKIFQPFYRAEDELTRTAQGTGIGLTLVQGLVQQMGGSVKGRNRPEGGFAVQVALVGG